jgi:pimeloyl-ACP methyl ester carboxylesterase
MRKVVVDGVEIALVDQGQGPTVVLVHGFPVAHRMWNAQIEALSRRYRVIAPDLRGFGQSSVTEGEVTMERFADDLALMLGELGIEEPVILGGLSMGGYVALEFWRRHPAHLRALVLCDTRAEADMPEVAAARLTTAERVMREGAGFLVETMIPRLFVTAGKPNELPCVQATREVIVSQDVRGIAAAARGMARRADFTSWLGQIRVRSLALVGEYDVITTPNEMRGLADMLPQGWFIDVARAGHMAPLENPAETNAALLAFLAEVTGSAPETDS